MRTPLAAIVLGLMLAASPAAAQVDPCLADPLGCVGEVVTNVGDTVDEAPDTVDEVADGVVGTVDDVVEPDEGGNPPGPSGSGEGSGGGGANDRSTARGGPSAAGAADPAAVPRTIPPREPGRAAVSREDPRPPAGVIERLRRSLGQGGAAFVFPLALLLVVGTFLLVQSRFDRSDPKLALAPVDAADDVLPFT